MSNKLFLFSLTILLSVSSPHHHVVLSSSSSPSSSPVPHYEHIYHRPDPLSSFKPYHAGYNISNSHYWASAMFTGVHGYAMAGIWILGGLGFCIYLVVKNLSCSSASSSNDDTSRQHSHSYYLIPFLVVLLCTFLTIVASGCVLAANHNSMMRTRKLERTLLSVTQAANGTIRKVTNSIKKMRQILRPYNAPACIQLRFISGKLSNESRMIRRVVNKQRRSIERYIDIWYGSTAGVVSVDLVLVIAALVVLLLHWQPGLIMIIFFCWILTTLCWILTGFHFFLHNFAEDTCSALENFQQEPANNSLSKVLPCVNQAYADQIMIDIGSTVHKFINKVNSKITNLNGLLGLDKQAERSLSGFFKICNPFSSAPDYNYSPKSCPKDAIQISDIPNVLGRFTCNEDIPSVSCNVDRKFVSKATYNMAFAYTQTIQQLLDILPDIENLARCTFVKETFSDVLLHQCRPFRVSFKLMWISIFCLSTTMMILELAWIAKVYQNKGRSFRRFSVIPR